MILEDDWLPIPCSPYPLYLYSSGINQRGAYQTFLKRKTPAIAGVLIIKTDNFIRMAILGWKFY
ncbi:hypothetical protein SB49_09175 [Sediminicola sp. YIK13]|nr:hypothetical protein SB49_09175 [Sediminicola sp. YIK13]